ncbi:hypothetical protein [Endozoicomonas sp. G2_2]|uniref:hypothetical protein n=1 Tax=Endozoicomonas sp. G2_2 TaxID=2821092 RepID=UPI001AD9C246|nr:hypothetical protein [Endozoicomonas sp. G2_2]
MFNTLVFISVMVLPLMVITGPWRTSNRDGHHARRIDFGLKRTQTAVGFGCGHRDRNHARDGSGLVVTVP